MSNSGLSSDDQRKLWLATIVEARLRWPAGHRRRLEVFHAAVAGIGRANTPINPGRAGVALEAEGAAGVRRLG